MKGVYPTVSHSLLLLLGLTAMSMIVVSIYASLSKTETNLIATELNFFADSTRNRVLEVYGLANGSSGFTGLFALNLPEEVGNRRYSVTLYQGGLFVNTTVGGTPIGISRTLPIDADLNGTSFMPASLRIGKQDGRIKIELVE